MPVRCSLGNGQGLSKARINRTLTKMQARSACMHANCTNMYARTHCMHVIAPYKNDLFFFLFVPVLCLSVFTILCICKRETPAICFCMFFVCPAKEIVVALFLVFSSTLPDFLHIFCCFENGNARDFIWACC